MLAAFPVCLGLLLLGKSLLVPESLQHTHDVLTFLGTAGEVVAWKTLAVLVALVIVPFVEELVFRGIVQSALAQFLGGKWSAVLITSALFAVLHLGFDGEQGRVCGYENILFAICPVSNKARLMSSITDGG